MNDHKFDEMLREHHRAFTGDIARTVAGRPVPHHTSGRPPFLSLRLTMAVSRLFRTVLAPSERLRQAAGIGFIAACLGVVVFFGVPSEPEGHNSSAASPGGLQSGGLSISAPPLAVRETSVWFYPDSVRMTPGGLANVIAAAATIGPGDRVDVVGRTARVGNASSAREFSLRRARAVADVLVRQGVSERQLTVRGAGFDDSPVVAGGDAAAKSRRVDIGVIGPD